MNQHEKFYQRHHQQSPFILANAWNVRSAQLIEETQGEEIYVRKKEITSATSLPVNVVGTPKLPVETLAACGVRRISMAVLLYKAIYNQMEKTARAICAENSISPLF